MRTMYHTQGYKLPYLNRPIICCRDDAWLGEGYYFWYDENDAIYWGQIGKRQYGKYVIYSAKINCEDIIDTVFKEEHLNNYKKSQQTKVRNSAPNVR